MKTKLKHTLDQKKITRLLILFLSITLAIGSISLVYNTVTLSDYNYQPSENSLMYTLQDNNYTRMRTQIAYYSQEEIAENQFLSEYYNVALYFENSMMYHAFLETDATQAAFYQAAAGENAANMGDLSYQKALIDALLIE